MRARSRQVRRVLGILGIAAITASALVAVGVIGGSAISLDKVTVLPDSGDSIGVMEGQHTAPQIAAPSIGPKTLGPSDVVGKFTDTGAMAASRSTATIGDETLAFDWSNAPDGPYVKVEGGSVAVQAAFSDNNQAFPVKDGPVFDPGISATIDWGDGSAVQSVTPGTPPNACDCTGNIGVSASHVYDAPKTA